MSRDSMDARGLALAWTAVLAAALIAWQAMPDIPVDPPEGNGCGRWGADELSRHRRQLALLLLPLLIAQAISAAWVRRRGGNAGRFLLYAAGGLLWALLLLWQPANAAFVWAQLLSIVVVPAVGLALLVGVVVSLLRDPEQSEPPTPRALALLALAPPFVCITVVLWTRTPWIWTC